MTETMIAATTSTSTPKASDEPRAVERGDRREIARAKRNPGADARHWLVVNFMRERFLATGAAPSIRALGKESESPSRSCTSSFRKVPAKLAAKIGGIPKPQGCI